MHFADDAVPDNLVIFDLSINGSILRKISINMLKLVKLCLQQGGGHIIYLATALIYKYDVMCRMKQTCNSVACCVTFGASGSRFFTTNTRKITRSAKSPVHSISRLSLRF